jgi:N-acetylglucosaminyldiphosphoundecaprenol N-acetyl-beta-D-mannosaminyltransferase
VRDVFTGRAQWVGARLDAGAVRGVVSPIEPRLHLGLVYEDLVDAEREALRGRSVKRDLGVLARTIAARALGGGGSACPDARPHVVSARVDNVSVREALELILRPATSGRARFVAFAHPHALNLARFDADLRKHLAEADAVLPDGVGLRIASRILGTPIAANVNGTDLLPVLCREAAARGVKLAFVGAKPGVADRAAANLRRAHAGLDIAFVRDGYLDPTSTIATLETIRSLGRVVVLVGMGSPVQERWCRDARTHAPEATFVTVGGLFDFFSGDVPRAPVAVRELGLEWAFRMVQDPKRLAKRYLVGNPVFLALALADRVRTRRSTHSEEGSLPEVTHRAR